MATLPDREAKEKSGTELFTSSYYPKDANLEG